MFPPARSLERGWTAAGPWPVCRVYGKSQGPTPGWLVPLSVRLPLGANKLRQPVVRRPSFFQRPDT